MPKNSTLLFYKILIGCGLGMLLIAVRLFENELFYDPFLSYFKSDYTNQPFPNVDKLSLFLSLFFRYFLNSTLSLAFIFLLFREKEMVKFAGFLYFFFFVTLLLVLFYIIVFDENPNHLIFFYVRRFLIQPLFLVLFVPAFFYQKQIK